MLSLDGPLGEDLVAVPVREFNSTPKQIPERFFLFGGLDDLLNALCGILPVGQAQLGASPVFRFGEPLDRVLVGSRFDLQHCISFRVQMIHA